MADVCGTLFKGDVMKQTKETLLLSMREAIDTLQIERLWKLAMINPNDFFTLLCSRYLYKKRMDKLYFHLSALDRDKMDKFQRLMLARVEGDIGTGLFKNQ